MSTTLTTKIVLAASAGVIAFSALAADAPRAERAENTPAAATARSDSQNAADTSVTLDLDKLKRGKRDKPIPDLLAPVRMAGPEPGKPEAPSAPALPFNYIGRMLENGKESVFISRGDDSFSAQRGAIIDKQYRLEQVTDSALTFIYLPLGTRQVLNVPATN